MHLLAEIRNDDQLLNIAVIEPSGRLYGSEFCLFDIVTGLSRLKYSWNILLPKGGGFDQLLLNEGINCEFLIPSNLSSMSKLRRIPFYLKIMLYLRQNPPHLLYVNQSGSLRAAAFYARWLKLLTICQVQTLEDARWIGMHPELHKDVKAFICNSQFIADETECAPDKKCVLYQGLPTRRLEKARMSQLKPENELKLGRDAENFTVGILGRIAVSKGHYLLLDAAQKVNALMPDCRFVVIGEGLTARDTEKFVSAVEAGGLIDVFEFRGYQSDLETELSRLDLLVIPSLAEPLGRVLFDAAEHGVPVVVSDNGGFGEVSVRFNIGVRFESRNSEALSDAIIKVRSNHAETCQQFYTSSILMFERLSMKSYLSVIERILIAANNRTVSSQIWLGDEHKA